MNIDYLIQLLTNRLNGLNLAKDQAFQAGDLERINAVDAELLDVQNTLSKLKLLSSIEQTALATPFSEAEVVKNGIEASFNPTVLNDSTEILLEYDITPYATDPMHELKIQNILEKMGVMDSPEKIETYIKKTSPDSPLSGLMVWNAVLRYEVDARLMLALMELDSRFGTVGVAVRTMNPGNVGNNGVDERTYPSWEEGVMAVAKWLNNHRIEKVAPTEEVVPEVEEETLPEEETEVVPEEVVPEETEIIPEEPVVVPEEEIPLEEPEVVPEETPVVEEAPIIETPVDTTTTPDPVVGIVKRKAKRKLT
jgi:hypothetical protein